MLKRKANPFTWVTSIEIRPDFHDFELKGMPWPDSHLHHPNIYLSQGGDGYPIPALKPPITLDTNAPFNLLYGRIGCGKSTLLTKLQAREGLGIHGGNMFKLRWDQGDEPTFMGVKGSSQEKAFLRHYGYYRWGEQLKDRMKDATRSSGEHIIEQLGGWIRKSGTIGRRCIAVMDQPEDYLDLHRLPSAIDLVRKYNEELGIQFFIATNHPAFLKLPNAKVINFLKNTDRSPEAKAECIPANEFSLEDYIKPLRITPDLKPEKAEYLRHSRIISLATLGDFYHYTYTGPIHESFNGIQRIDQCLDGYDINSYEMSKVYNTDANIVVIVGDNGSGKSSLVRKLFGQLTLGRNVNTGKYLMIDHVGQVPYIEYILDVEQPEPYVKLFTKYDARKEELSRLSRGEFRWHILNEALDDSREYPDNAILVLDQPEDGLDFTKIPSLVEKAYSYAMRHNRQIFIVTHEPAFLKLDGIVINLYKHQILNPRGIAQSMRTKEFNTLTYMGHS